MQDNQITNWYTVKVQNNYEAIVASRIQLEMERANKKINIIIPKERKISAKKGVKVVKDKMLYPGYIFVETTHLGELMGIIRATTGATNILSTRDERKPIPLKFGEVRQMLLAEEEIQKPVSDELYFIGESIKVLVGVFENFVGIIDEIDVPHNKVKVLVKIFNKSTSVELDIDGITKNI